MNSSSHRHQPHRVDPDPPKLRIFLDADVLFAGAASPSEYGASLLILQLAEITLIEAFTSEQVIVEAERNLSAKLPQALPAFHHLVSRCLKICPDPAPGDLVAYRGLADPKDLPILVAAKRENCSCLITFNLRHCLPGHPGVDVLKPGDFILRVRDQLAHL
jgi:predicted nucleic acid-binding protein